MSLNNYIDHLLNYGNIAHDKDYLMTSWCNDNRNKKSSITHLCNLQVLQGIK